ncbi:MAG: YjbQ family protein [Planctomycetes bacterium]|nr:YjbQ family protein [Planctomycetota bacterium]
MSDEPVPIALARTIRLSTAAGYSCHDLTDDVRRHVAEAGLQEGIVTVFCTGSTGGVTTVEYEPGLVKDLAELFDRLAPEGPRYHHDDRWHDGNGHAHVRASLLGPSLTVPVAGGKLLLGTWQQIVFLDFDPPPREREIVVQILGR